MTKCPRKLLPRSAVNLHVSLDNSVHLFSLLFFVFYMKNTSSQSCFIYLYSDPGHKADGEVVARSEEQPEQIRQLHSEDADRYSTQ